MQNFLYSEMKKSILAETLEETKQLTAMDQQLFDRIWLMPTISIGLDVTIDITTITRYNLNVTNKITTKNHMEGLS